MREIGFNGFNCKTHGGPGLTVAESCSMIYELAFCDMGLALFFFLQNSMGIQVYDHCCSDAQKDKFLPDLIALKKVTCFGLTEPNNGSDATGMTTTAKKVEGGYIINGQKRWPGNATIADFTIVWAKNVSDGNKIQGFVVEKGMKGHTATAIPNKAAVRMV